MEVDDAPPQMTHNQQVIFKGFIDGIPTANEMEVKVGGKIKLKVPTGSNAVLVKNLYLSCDPYMRGRMRNFSGSYIAPFVPGSVIEGFCVSRVVDSDNPNFKAGEILTGMTGWEEYSLIHKTEDLRKIEQNDIPLSYYLGLLGMPGLTAYAGFYEVCSPKKGENVFVSAASGGVGQLVGQLAKIHGCYVVGSAGTNLKVDLLKNKLGFDDAFNYKEEPNLGAALKRYFPRGIDIYFDNVGGSMLDAALGKMRVNGRIAICGMVSQVSLSKPQGIHNMFNVISKRITIKGFLNTDYWNLFPRLVEDMSKGYREGKIVYIEDMSHGLEAAPPALIGLFSGENVGKKVVCVATE